MKVPLTYATYVATVSAVGVGGSATSSWITVAVENLDLLHDVFVSRGPARSLETASSLRECNTRIGTIKRDEVVGILNAIYASDESTVSYINDVLATSVLKYDVASYKICGSCQDLLSRMTENVEVSDMTTLPEACDVDMYGFDAVHSSLALVPLDPSTGEIVGGSLRGIKYYHGTRLVMEEVPSNAWPESVSDALQSGDPEVIGALLPSLGETSPASASAGNVVIAPDYLGYGESQATHNRTYLVEEGYEQSAIVSWLSTQMWLSDESGGCSQLENTATIEGASEGGFAATAASAVLNEMGVRILGLKSYAPVISLEAISLFLVMQYDNNMVSPDKSNGGYPGIAPLSGFSFSQSLPHLANTGYPNQTLLSSEWMVQDNFERNILAWMSAPDPLSVEEIFGLMPPFVPDIFNPALVQFYRDAIAQNTTTPCSYFDDLVERGVDKLCAANYDMTPVIQTTTYPIELCYSSADTLIPEFQFVAELFENSLVSRTVGPDGSPLSEGMDHGGAAGTCIVFNLFNYLSSGAVPGSDPNDLPFTISPLENAPASCSAEPETPAPTPGTTSGTSEDKPEDPSSSPTTMPDATAPPSGVSSSSGPSVLSGSYYAFIASLVALKVTLVSIE